MTACSSGSSKSDDREYFNLGLYKIKTKNYKQAIKYFTKSIQNDPSHINSYYYRGVCYENLKHYKLAISDFTEVLRRNDKIRRKLHRVIVLKDKSIKNIAIPLNFIDSLFKRGICFYYIKRYMNCIMDLNAVLQIGHKLFTKEFIANIYYIQGVSYYQLNNYILAVKYLTYSIKTDPRLGKGKPYFWRAKAFNKLGEHKKAEKDYQKGRLIESKQINE